MIFAALFELVMTTEKYWMTLVQKICTKLQQMYKKVEAGLVRWWSFVRYKYRPCQEKIVLQISVHQSLGSNICKIQEGSTRPFNLFNGLISEYIWIIEYELFALWSMCREIIREIKICSFRPQQIYLKYLDADKMRDKVEISIWNIGCR